MQGPELGVFCLDGLHGGTGSARAKFSLGAGGKQQHVQKSGGQKPQTTARLVLDGASLGPKEVAVLSVAGRKLCFQFFLGHKACGFVERQNSNSLLCLLVLFDPSPV